METVANDAQEKKSRFFINAVSIIVPLVVAVLLGLPAKLDLGAWTKTLPHFIGLINTLTTIVLIIGFVFIKRNKIDYHRIAMTIAFCLGGLFLIFYVTYHLTNPANKFAGEGFARYVYLFFLITHVGLSLVVLPLVLRAMFYAVTGQFEKHKKLTRYAFPVWLYVSTTGVIVYLMLYQLFRVK